MRPINYKIINPNSTAVNILRSWLNAINIPNKNSEVLGFDICIAETTQVKVCLNEAEFSPNGVNVLSKHFTGKNTKTALNAFYQVLKAAGYPPKSPLNRGAEPTLNAKGNPAKLHYRNEDFLVAIRHTEFRRSPNPPPDRWAKYKNTMEAVVISFLCTQKQLCQRHGIEKDDLMQYARCLMVNFCSRYEILDPVHCDNERKFYEYLKQRFIYDVFRILKKKERSMTPEPEVVQIARFGEAYGDLDSTPATNRPKTKKLRKQALKTLLAKMPHDKMISSLIKAIKNDSLELKVREKASKYLKNHAKNCSKCTNLGAQEIK